MFRMKKRVDTRECICLCGMRHTIMYDACERMLHAHVWGLRPHASVRSVYNHMYLGNLHRVIHRCKMTILPLIEENMGNKNILALTKAE